LKSIEIPASDTFVDPSAFPWLSPNSMWVSRDNTRLRLREWSLVFLIPSSVCVFGKANIFRCSALESIAFESGSRLERLEKCAFAGTALKSILIPSSVVVLGKSSFGVCESLESIVFQSGFRLEGIEGGPVQMAINQERKKTPTGA
jgi:hypothetical protein